MCTITINNQTSVWQITYMVHFLLRAFIQREAESNLALLETLANWQGKFIGEPFLKMTQSSQILNNTNSPQPSRRRLEV